MKKILSALTIIFWLFTSPSLAFAQSVQTATLSLDPATGTYIQGCSYSINVNLNTGGVQTDGTDAILHYDASRFNVTSITNGTIYPDYPGNNIDPSGVITISGLASVSTPYSGSGILATINFTVQPNAPTGLTQITFDFDPNNKANTKDSNVVQRGTVVDTLNSVVNGSYTIGTANGTCILPKTGQGAVGTASGQLKTIDQIVDKTGKGTGTPELTFTLAIVGSVLTILGVLGLVIL